MEWVISLNRDDGYAEVVTSGVADREGSLDMAKAIPIALGRDKVKRVLIDHTELHGVAGGTMDILDRPQEFGDIGVIRGIRVAEVVRPEHQDFFRFLETVCLNRGYAFSMFADREPALEWLLAP